MKERYIDVIEQAVANGHPHTDMEFLYTIDIQSILSIFAQ